MSLDRHHGPAARVDERAVAHREVTGVDTKGHHRRAPGLRLARLGSVRTTGSDADADGDVARPGIGP